MKCGNADTECEWEGTVGTLERHEATCEFTLIACPNQCGIVMRKELEKHLMSNCPHRDSQCMFCNERGTYADIQLHDETCKLKIVPCPLACGETVPRRDIDKHIQTECMKAVVPCKFKNVGCKRKMRRENMSTHELNDKLHLHMAINAVVKLQDTVIKLEDAVTELQHTNMLLRENFKSIIFALPEYQKQMEAGTKIVSPSFYTSRNGYHMAVIVSANGDSGGTHVAITALLLEGIRDDRLKWPFTGTLTFVLLNQLEDRNHHTMTSSPTVADNVLVGDDWGAFKFIPHSNLAHDPVKNTQYLKEDTLYFRVSVEETDHKPWLQCTGK